jgi:hypothetical protein
MTIARASASLVLSAAALAAPTLALILVLAPGTIACDVTDGGDAAVAEGAAAATNSHALDGTAVCNQLVVQCGETGLTLTDCEASFVAVLVSQPCLDGLKTASCTDLTNGASPIEQTCFPSCDAPGTNQCNTNDTVTECSSAGVTRVLDCKSLCTSRMKSYTGTCATSFQGQTAALPQCWCE